MHSIYWVPSRQCNQRCPHCYNDSSPEAPGISLEDASRAIANMPAPDHVPVDMVMISGGEVLAWPDLLFHCLRELNEHFGEHTELTLQTNGDMLDAATLKKMLDHRVTSISIASNDPYHKKSTRQRLAGLEKLMLDHGLKRKAGPDDDPEVDPGDDWWHPEDERVPRFDIWGANEGNWIGPLWPRGRAHQYDLSNAKPEHDFCGNWSGAVGFLDYHNPETCQVNVQLTDVYPCCPMTCRPIGDLKEQSLIDMLDACASHPVYRALNEGKPEKMAEYAGLSEEYGYQRSRELGNHCLWCDEFFTHHAPDLLHHSARTERGTIDLTVSAA